jgi:hypothetical protein
MERKPPSGPVRSDPPVAMEREQNVQRGACLACHHCIFHCEDVCLTLASRASREVGGPLFPFDLIRMPRAKKTKNKSTEGGSARWLRHPERARQSGYGNHSGFEHPDGREAQGRMEPMEPGIGNRPTTLSKKNLFLLRVFIESTPNLIASPESTTYVHRKLREAEGKKKTTTGVKVKGIRRLLLIWKRQTDERR